MNGTYDTANKPKTEQHRLLSLQMLRFYSIYDLTKCICIVTTDFQFENPFCNRIMHSAYYIYKCGKTTKHWQLKLTERPKYHSIKCSLHIHTNFQTHDKHGRLFIRLVFRLNLLSDCYNLSFLTLCCLFFLSFSLLVSFTVSF